AEPAWDASWGWWTRGGRRRIDVILAPPPAVAPTARFLTAAGMRGALETTRMSLAPVGVVARERFVSDEARALFAAGISHSDVSVSDPASTPGAMALAMVAEGPGL